MRTKKFGTSNFYVQNADKTYPIGVSDGEEDYEVDMNEELEDAKEVFKENGFNECSTGVDMSRVSDRNWTAESLGVSKGASKGSFAVELFPIARSGYYEGACLDYIYCVYVNQTDDYWSYDYQSVNDMVEDIFYDQRAFDGKGDKERAASIIEGLLGQLNEAFNAAAKMVCGGGYEQVGPASNGESMYKKSESEKEFAEGRKRYNSGAEMMEDFRNVVGEKVMNKFINNHANIEGEASDETIQELFDACANRPSRLVFSAFRWNKSPEGVDYWSRINDMWWDFVSGKSDNGADDMNETFSSPRKAAKRGVMK